MNLKSALLALALALPPFAASAAPPTLEVEALPSTEKAGERLARVDGVSFLPAMELTGLADAGPPIRVLLAPDGSRPARGVPPWISGYTDGVSGVVVLLPERTPAYPDGGLEEVLRHEVAHVLVARAAGFRPVPRWFDEGLAMAAARPWNLEDRTRFALELLQPGRVPLEGLPALFAGEKRDVARAYALSGAFVQDLLERYGPSLPGRLLSLVARGESFREAFFRTTGNPLAEEEEGFHARRTSWERWLPLLTSTLAIWTGITLLALWAIRKRRRRDTELRRRWTEEESTRPFDDGPVN